MKTPYIIILLLALSMGAVAQNIRGAALIGINGCQVDGDTQSGYNKPGIRAGFTVSSPTDKTLSFESGLLFTSKGAIKKTKDYTEFKTKLNYVELPLIIKYHFVQKFGIDATISYNHQISSKIIDQNGTETKNPGYLKKYDVTASLGVRYYINSQYQLTANFGYSITKITDDPQMPYWRNNYINLSIVRYFGKPNSEK